MCAFRLLTHTLTTKTFIQQAFCNICCDIFW